MKDSYYFPHDYHARHDPKLEKLRISMGCEGVGIFWCLVEMLYEENGYLTIADVAVYSKLLFSETDKIMAVIKNYDLFTINEGRFYSDTLLKRLEHLRIKREKAKESASHRWNANAMRTHSEGNAIKESKGKESNTIGQFESLWSKYPKKLGKDKALKTFTKDQKEFNSIETALENYLKYLRVSGTDEQYIKHGSTWFNSWRDWLTYEAKIKALCDKIGFTVEFQGDPRGNTVKLSYKGSYVEIF